MSIDQSTQTQPGKRSWFARHKVLTGIGAFVVVAGIAGAAGGGGSNKDTAAQADKPAASTSSSAASDTATDAVKDTPAAPASTGGPSAVFPMVDGDWRLDSVNIENEQYTNDFTGRARITYIGDDTNGGNNSFTITVFKGTKDVASMTGFATTVMPGQTKTVDLFSTNNYVSGAKKYSFQNDW